MSLVDIVTVTHHLRSLLTCPALPTSLYSFSLWPAYLKVPVECPSVSVILSLSLSNKINLTFFSEALHNVSF